MKIIILFLIFLFWINLSYSYELTKDDINKLDSISNKILDISKSKQNNFLDNVLSYIEKFSQENINDDKKLAYLNYLYSKINDYYKNEISNNNTLNLIQKYQNEIIWNELKLNCKNYYDLVDSIAKQNDFPTELIIAIWSKEYNCQLSNPTNWHGPYQIFSYYYNPWELSQEDFLVETQDFIDFAKEKIDYFNSNKDYEIRFWKKISLSYNNYNENDIKLFSILYNWIRNNTDLETNLYTNWNLNNNLKNSSDWIFVILLKVLIWKNKN